MKSHSGDVQGVPAGASIRSSIYRIVLTAVAIVFVAIVITASGSGAEWRGSSKSCPVYNKP